MKNLIANDEPMARLGLISMIQERYPQNHEILEAGEGIAALRFA